MPWGLNLGRNPHRSGDMAKYPGRGEDSDETTKHFSFNMGDSMWYKGHISWINTQKAKSNVSYVVCVVPVISHRDECYVFIS